MLQSSDDLLAGRSLQIATEVNGSELSGGDTELARRQRVLAETASITRSIADAVTLKEGDIFLLSERGGLIPLGGPHGLGLYYHDCRYLNG